MSTDNVQLQSSDNKLEDTHKQADTDLDSKDQDKGEVKPSEPIIQEENKDPFTQTLDIVLPSESQKPTQTQEKVDDVSEAQAQNNTTSQSNNDQLTTQHPDHPQGSTQTNSEQPFKQQTSSQPEIVVNTNNQPEFTSDDQVKISGLMEKMKICVTNEPTYKANRIPFLQQIKLGNRFFCKALVDTVLEILFNKGASDISKFLVLFFLKEAMDLQNPGLINYVEEVLITQVGNIVEGNESEIFSAETGNQNVRKSFGQLIIECIYFWSDYYGVDKSGNPNKFRTTMERVRQKIINPPTKAIFFVKKPQDANNMGSPTGKAQPQTIPTQLGIAQGDSQSICLQKINGILQVLSTKKVNLLKVFNSEPKPSLDTLEAIAKDLKIANNLLNESKNLLLNMEHPEAEKTLTKVLEDSNFLTKYLEDYDNLKAASEQFRVSTIESLTKKPVPKDEGETGSAANELRKKHDLQILEKHFKEQDEEAQKLQVAKRRKLLIYVSVFLPMLLVIVHLIQSRSS